MRIWTQLICCSLTTVCTAELFVIDFGSKFHPPDDGPCDLSLVDVTTCADDEGFGIVDTGCSADYPTCLDEDGNPSMEGTQCAGFCFGAEQPATDIVSMLTSPEDDIEDFIDDTGIAIEGILPFVEEVRSVFAGDNETGPISDTDIVLLAMLPNPTTESDSNMRRALTLTCEEKTPGTLAARVLDFMVEAFDLAFSLAGASVFGGIGGSVGAQIANNILSGPRGPQFAAQLANIAATSGKNPAALGQVIAGTFAEVGANGFLDALSQAPDITGFDLAVTGLSFVANLLGTGLTGGVALGLKITNGLLSLNDFYKAADALTEYAELMCPPTAAPTAPPPTMAPVSDPPTREPSPRQPEDPRGRGWTTGVFGDPHLSTFNRLRFDCQASGEFTMVTSLQTPAFAIQERFESVGSNVCSQASVSTGVVINEPGIPKVQISIGHEDDVINTGSLSVVGNECPINVYVDGSIQESVASLEDLNDQVTISWPSLRIFFPFTGVQVRPTIRYSPSFGCHFTLQVFIPFVYRSDETILGLLGTPNNLRGDDWISSDGSPYANPTNIEESIFGASYEYCVSQWCIQDETASLFTYGPDESFASYYQCDREYSDELQTAIEQAIATDDELVSICGDNLFCFVDGLCGDSDDARTVLEEEEEVVVEQDNSDPENCDVSENECCIDSDCPASDQCVNRVCLTLGTLTVRLTWFGNGDNDLSVTTPCGFTINFDRRKDSFSGGFLDQDSKGSVDQADAMESIVFSDLNRMPAGNYSIQVSYFTGPANPWVLDIFRNGESEMDLSGVGTSELFIVEGGNATVVCPPSGEESVPLPTAGLKKTP